MSHQSPYPPTDAPGWPHVWDGGKEQLPITDEQATALIDCGVLEWSGSYRVYCPAEGYGLEDIEKMLSFIPESPAEQRARQERAHARAREHSWEMLAYER